MPLTLPPELEAEVAALVASGRYSSEGAVLDEAFAALREREEHAAKRAALLADIAAANADIAAGRFVTTSAAEILAEVRGRKAKES